MEISVLKRTQKQHTEKERKIGRKHTHETRHKTNPGIAYGANVGADAATRTGASGRLHLSSQQ